MVRIPTEQIAAFPEPDHSTEFAVQEMYEMTRDGGWAHAYDGIEDEPRDWREFYRPLELDDPFELAAEVRELVAEANARVDQPQGAHPAVCREAAENPISHQEYWTTRFGKPRCCSGR